MIIMIEVISINLPKCTDLNFTIFLWPHLTFLVVLKLLAVSLP